MAKVDEKTWARIQKKIAKHGMPKVVEEVPGTPGYEKLKEIEKKRKKKRSPNLLPTEKDFWGD